MYCAKAGIIKFHMPPRYSIEKGDVNDYSTLPRPQHNLALIRSGKGYADENGNIIPFESGDILFIPKGCKYVSHWQGDPTVFTTAHFIFHPQYDPFADKNIPVQTFRIEGATQLYDRLIQLSESTNEDSFLFNAVFYELLGKIAPQIKYEEISFSPRMRPAIEYIRANCTKRLSVKQLADMCYLSEPRFFTLFKEETGYPPIEYKNRLCIRIAESALLAEPDKTVECIAIELGFESAVYFRRQFKQVTGLTPTEYRAHSSLI